MLSRGVQSISELISTTGLVNLDFADVTSIMSNAGLAHMGVGNGKGKDKAEAAAKMAISSPLLETSISGARGIIVNITASPDIGFEEVDTASNMIATEAHPDANIIWGAAFDPSLEDEMRVTVIATGFTTEKKGAVLGKRAASPAAAAPKAADTASAEKAETPANDDEYDLILDILNKSKKRKEDENKRNY
ncbi:Cell division protein FtsZ [bioreactor metagenome]|uniref:Cell division protein FtsZ n=1 Tax=bioreactor metagenome TaxID=1076179 RepID=A0A645GH50_9ZZZZ